AAGSGEGGLGGRTVASSEEEGPVYKGRPVTEQDDESRARQVAPGVGSRLDRRVRRECRYAGDGDRGRQAEGGGLGIRERREPGRFRREGAGRLGQGVGHVDEA